MKNEDLFYFLASYFLIFIALMCAFFESSILSGLFFGISIFVRKSVDASLPVFKLQDMPKWEVFSAIYLLIIAAFTLKNMGADFMKIDALIFTLIIFFPFLIPFAIQEYKNYKILKQRDEID